MAGFGHFLLVMTHEKIGQDIIRAARNLGMEDLLYARRNGRKPTVPSGGQEVSKAATSAGDNLGGKILIGRDLGAPGVLPASELISSRIPRSDHKRGRLR